MKEIIKSGRFAPGYNETKYVSVKEDWSPCFNSSKCPRKSGEKADR